MKVNTWLELQKVRQTVPKDQKVGLLGMSGRHHPGHDHAYNLVKKKSDYMIGLYDAVNMSIKTVAPHSTDWDSQTIDSVAEQGSIGTWPTFYQEGIDWLEPKVDVLLVSSGAEWADSKFLEQFKPSFVKPDFPKELVGPQLLIANSMLFLLHVGYEICPRDVGLLTYKEGLWTFVAEEWWRNIKKIDIMNIPPYREGGLALSSSFYSTSLSTNAADMKSILKGKPFVTDKTMTIDDAKAKIAPIGGEVLDFTKYSGGPYLDYHKDEGDTYIYVHLRLRLDVDPKANPRNAQYVYYRDGIIL
jgi:hypothetical protein